MSDGTPCPTGHRRLSEETERPGRARHVIGQSVLVSQFGRQLPPLAAQGSARTSKKWSTDSSRWKSMTKLTASSRIWTETGDVGSVASLNIKDAHQAKCSDCFS